MSPADNTPDFDNMSPEEMMAWMEKLAQNQGATEGFTTDEESRQKIEISEIDPDSVDIKDDYVPSNWSGTKEEWQQKQAEERAARQAAAAPAPPSPTPEPEPVAAAPEPEPVAEAAPAGGEIDYENMSPEELMAFMETLAARQGATEGFTLDEESRQMDIAEIDPDSVDIKDDYVPSNWSGTKEEWQQKQAEERAAKAAAPPPAPEPEPVAEELPVVEEEEEATVVAEATEAAGEDWLASLASEEAEEEFPQMDLSGLGEELPGMEFPDLGEEFPQMDLSDFGSDLEIPDLEGLEDLGVPIDAQDTAQADPMDWLENLAEQQAEPTEESVDAPSLDFLGDDIAPVTSGVTDPDEAEVDPLQWLESLAEQQGVDSEEFITDAGIDVPAAQQESPRTYSEYTVEEEEFASPVDELDAASDDSDDPVKWLEGLAQSVGEPQQEEPPAQPEPAASPPEPVAEASEPAASEDDILEKLRGAQEIDPQDMENWMAGLLDKGLSRPDVPPLDDEEEAEIELEANIPDWLIEQVGPPPDMDESAEEAEAPAEPEVEAEVAAEIDDIFAADTPEAAEATEIPDWLQDSAPADETPIPDLGDLDTATPAEVGEIPDWLQESAPDATTGDEDIFAAAPAAPAAAPDSDEMIDMSDSWAEAFEAERTTGDTVPSWYEAALSGQSTSEQEEVHAASQLAEAQFTEETKLSAGELEAVPDWIEMVEQPEPAEVESEPVAATPFVETPVAVESEASASELPDWLRETVDEGEEVVASEELPDWLKEAEDVDIEEVPDWLVETIEDGVSQVQATLEEAAPVVAEPAAKPSAPPAPTPTPVAAPPPAADVVAALESARSKLESDLDGALEDYESVVRANSALDEVVKDLKKLIDDTKYKRNPAIYRVLGDGLMRQGQLQEALNTYRKALNLL